MSDHAALVDKIMRSMPIADRGALERMTVAELENIQRGYRIKGHPEPQPWRPSDLQRTWCPLTCHACERKWNMPLYINVPTTVWCPHCGVECLASREPAREEGGEPA